MEFPLDVTFNLRTSPWSINETLSLLSDIPLMSFDIDTRGLYSKDQRKEALKLLDTDLDLYTHKLASVVANNDGLSFPSLIL